MTSQFNDEVRASNSRFSTTTSQVNDEVRRQLAVQHDNLLSWTMLNRKERRRRGVRTQKRELERMLFATGLVISQSGKP